MPNELPSVYEGYRDYIFVSYAHADSDAVMPIIDALDCEGFRVWYDAGIEVGEEFPDHLARHVYGCSCFIAFFSHASLASGWCRQEVNFALDLGKRVLPVFLDDVELSLGLRMRLASIQSMYREQFESDDAFCRELLKVRMLDSCLTAKGARRRGAKPRGAVPPQVEGTEVTGGKKVRLRVPFTSQAHPVDSGLFYGGVERRAELSEYSWAELKELSRAIAAAGSDVDGLAIARAHGLVNKDGRLQGDTKPLTLTGGRRTSVRILGFRHDELASGGRAGITFEFANAPTNHRVNPNNTVQGGWEKSELRGWLNGDFLARLPGDFRPFVEAAVKMTNNRGRVGSGVDASAVTQTEDELWLLSMSEVYGNLACQSWNVPRHSRVYDAEGIQYQLYADKGVSTSNCGSCKKWGASSWWWLRSPSADLSYRFCRVSDLGGWGFWDIANTDGGVSPGFCF